MTLLQWIGLLIVLSPGIGWMVREGTQYGWDVVVMFLAGLVGIMLAVFFWLFGLFLLTGGF